MSNFEFVCFDIEANGFRPNTIFCICITDLVTRESRSYYGDDIPEALILLSEAKLVVGHFIRGYDCPVIERLTDGVIVFDPLQIIDTLDMSKKLTDFRKHSLQMWGEIFGLPKRESPLFESFSPEMVPYCERDVEINVMVFFHLVEKYLEGDRKTWFRNCEKLEEFFAAL